METSTTADNQGRSSPAAGSDNPENMWPSSILERVSTPPLADPVARFPHVGSMLRLRLTRVM